ncbi:MULTISPECIES: type II toxin-antitoxin system RelE family toxin [Deinococcus]|uniref:Type II toxin-antitoxin system RelE/ParE family toxin n=1 Tax=Deinococcus rufus TaxID=2136097 RepID=A0ABV7Z8Z9_9DEIO|nr:type II toxin-antitoxin system mRNA interferase toxin, RelE/StbE family [Deinococcus sp. AB2017081]WQE97456.1 type II toxin-antitoxin system mRNA interferase toxin, RelE/StbE family [Deinococcus sp. AB2017081]WQE97479.1 type II toxin-antitoxin system mRNA interferase toxin, RelE/StbE family [Deinococcus sp. AB2017081]
MTEYQVGIDEQALSDIDAISDQRTVEAIYRRIADLKTEPQVQGKALTGDLKGYRSVRAGGQRYRIVYEVIEAASAVDVVVVGIRKDGHRTDAYAIAEKRLT